MYSLWDNFPTKLRSSTGPKTRAGAKFNGEVGFPHSEIVGSKFAHNSPTLIAACHVLHRLCMPRHPPNALTSRLRVHTANVRAEDRKYIDEKSIASRPLPGADDLDKNLSLLFTNVRSLARSNAVYSRHRFQNPFTMSKNAGRNPLTGRGRIWLSSYLEKCWWSLSGSNR